MIRTVIFDLGGVIVPFDFRRAYQAMAGLCPYAAEEIPRRIAATDLVRGLESGRLKPEEFVERLCELLDLRMSYAEFCRLWSSIFLPETLIPESLLEALARRYRLLLLSNTNAIHFEMIREHYPLLAHFHHAVLSYEVGALKPAPEIYRDALAHAGCTPGECFYTDDVAAYVEGARREGIDAVQFESLAQLEHELRRRGIRFV